jgi:formylglycine-generating enzyme required for sulfatase activity
VAGDSRINPRDQATYLFVPGGEFPMGSEIEPDEMPQHMVDVASFWIGQTEVTNAQYARCVEAGECTAPRNDEWSDAAKATHPVTYVDWSQASAYAAWVGGRLPTEAEWEKAAHGTETRNFPWGDAVTDEQRLNFNSPQGPVAVGSYPAGASPYGALDMAGNVEEWVADWYAPDYYSEAPYANPTGPADGRFHIVRGGSYTSSRGDVRTTKRGRALPDSAFPGVGFRVVVPEL